MRLSFSVLLQFFFFNYNFKSIEATLTLSSCADDSSAGCPFILPPSFLIGSPLVPLLGSLSPYSCSDLLRNLVTFLGQTSRIVDNLHTAVKSSETTLIGPFNGIYFTTHLILIIKYQLCPL